MKPRATIHNKKVTRKPEGEIPMLDLRAQYAAIGNEVRAALGEVLESQQFVLGPQLSALEHELAQYCGRGTASAWLRAPTR